MRYMILVKADKNTEAGVIPSQELLDAMGRFNAEMIEAGVMLAADGLKASSKGFRVRFEHGKTTVIDGPFAETTELVAGYWVIQVKSNEEALQWASRIPFSDGEEVEVRPMFEDSDFAQ